MYQDRPEAETIMARYADGPARLEAAVAGLSEDELDSAPRGGWSIRQIVHHIVDGDDLWKTCIKAALGNSEGQFSLLWYWDLPQDRWAERWAYAGRAIAPSLVLFRANRAHVLQLLREIPGAWDCTVNLPHPNGEIAPVSVGYVVEMQARHPEGHIRDIEAIRRVHSG